MERITTPELAQQFIDEHLLVHSLLNSNLSNYLSNLNDVAALRQVQVNTLNRTVNTDSSYRFACE